MLWALLAPIGALVVSNWRESVPWFFAYIVMTITSGVFDYFLGAGNEGAMSMKTIGVFFALNFAAMSSIIYFLVRYFVVEMDRIKTQLDMQHQLLEEEQKKLMAAGATRTLRSRHLPGKNNKLSHAVDLAVRMGKTVKWDWPLYVQMSKTIKAAAKLEKVPVEWGGAWKSFKDGPHYQLPWNKYPG